MSVAVSNLVWQYFHADMGLKMLALKLADNADEYGRNVYPSVETCARFVGASTRSIQRWLKELVQGGLIQPVKYVNGGRGKACEYQFNADFIRAYDPRVPHDQRPAWEFKCADKSVVDESDAMGPDAQQKGDTVSPFSGCKRVTPDAQKGDTAVSQKGDTVVSPQPSLTVIEPNTPLPPTGGEAEKFDINDLLAKIIEAHGCHSTSDTRAVLAELGKIGPDAASAKRLLADLRAEVSSNPQWQRDEGRFRPRLSKWLRGWRAAVAVGLPGAGAQSATPSAVDKTRELIAQMPVKAGKPSPEVLERMAKIRADARSATAGKGLRGRARSVVQREVEQESLSAENEGVKDGKD